MVLSILSAQGDQPTVAILYFTGQGLTPQQTKSLRNRFSSSLASTERVSMIAQSKVAGVLKKEGLEASDCATDECAGSHKRANRSLHFIVKAVISWLNGAFQNPGCLIVLTGHIC